jgi:hypothetical protein
MFCSECGRELTDDMSYCPKCGRPLKTGAAKRKPAEYEVCQLVSKSKGGKLRYEASDGSEVFAHGVEYGAVSGSLAEFPLISNADIVEQLLCDGWEVMTANEAGHVVLMRRLKRD